jgi:hypothetical protein
MAYSQLCFVKRVTENLTRMDIWNLQNPHLMEASSIITAVKWNLAFHHNAG